MEEVYKPPKILRRLIDYYLRQKVIEEFKSKPVKVINWFKIVLIELKRKMIDLRSINSYSGLLENPKYSGKMYEYKYVLPSHRRVKYYFDKPNTNKKSYCLFENDIFEYIKHPVISYSIQSAIKNVYGWDTNDTSSITIGEIKNILKTKVKYSTEYYNDILHNYLYREKYNPKNVPDKIKPYLIKVRFEVGKMDLTKTPRTYYDIKNLKWWDKTTLKTSNKGLKADTTYSWSEDGSRGGWTFGGITADDLERICLLNGFKIEKEIKIKNGKEKSKDKKYQYGDFANWFLHTLN